MDRMSNKEKLKLYQYGLYLLDNIVAFKNHLDQVYDFTKSTEPMKHWWWHLNRIITGDIVVKGSLSVETNIAL
ncbi:hypothetical protein WMZ97_17490 [Lentibacillus sp. N15]